MSCVNVFNKWLSSRRLLRDSGTIGLSSQRGVHGGSLVRILEADSIIDSQTRLCNPLQRDFACRKAGVPHGSGREKGESSARNRCPCEAACQKRSGFMEFGAVNTL